MKRLLASSAVVFCAVVAHAQVANNTMVVGTVTDAAGAVLAGAQVTAVNRDTKVAYPGKTNGSGFFSIPFVIPGTYDVTAELPGFRTVTSTGVVVTLNLAVRADLSLPVGATTEAVTVTAATPALSTDDAVIGETLTAKQVSNLPLNSRRVL